MKVQHEDNTVLWRANLDPMGYWQCRWQNMTPAWFEALRERIEMAAGRNAPVTRDDVRIYCCYIATAPLDAYEVVKLHGSDAFATLQPKMALWEPLIDELGARIPDINKAVRIRACIHCGRDFFSVDGVGGRRLFCSPGCHRDATANTKAWAAKMQRDKLSEKRAAQRANRTCAHCGKAFTPKRSTGQFCSPGCRVAAHRGKTAA